MVGGAPEGWEDDPSVPDSEDLWRRIHALHVIQDGNTGSARASSAAFSDSGDGSPMSVYLSSAVLESGRCPADLLAGRGGFGIVGVKASAVRQLNLGVARDPLPDEPAHGLVIGPKPKKVQRTLAKAASWVVDPASSS